MSDQKCKLGGPETWTKNPTYFQRKDIAIHASPGDGGLGPPKSHGCVRTELLASEIIHDNSVTKSAEGPTMIHVGGAWAAVHCYPSAKSSKLNLRADVCAHKPKPKPATDSDKKTGTLEPSVDGVGKSAAFEPSTAPASEEEAFEPSMAPASEEELAMTEEPERAPAVDGAMAMVEVPSFSEDELGGPEVSMPVAMGSPADGASAASEALPAEEPMAVAPEAAADDAVEQRITALEQAADDLATMLELAPEEAQSTALEDGP